MIATSSTKLVDVAGSIKDFVKGGVVKSLMIAGKIGQSFARVFGPYFGGVQNALSHTAAPSVAPGPSFGPGGTGPPPAARRAPPKKDGQ